MSKSFLARIQDLAREYGTISEEHAPFLDKITLDDDYMDLLNVGVYTPSDNRSISALSYSMTKNTPLVVAGCSETEGQLVANLHYLANREFMWHSYVGAKFNVDYTNISAGGISIYKIVDKLLKYLDFHKKPDVILALLPPLQTRMWIASDNSGQISTTGDSEKVNNGNVMHLMDIVFNSELAYVSKKPHLLDTILPHASYMAYSINAIKTLETVCKLANVSLIYSTWDQFSDYFFLAAKEYAQEKRMPDPFKNYVSTNPNYWSKANIESDEFAYSECHADLLLSDASAYFLEGLAGHMGTHRHAHIGEIFIEELTKRGYAASL